MKHLAAFILIIFLFTPVFSQVIKGNAPAFAGKKIELYTYKDYITKSKVLLDSARADAKGNFSFRPSAPKTFYAIIKSENFAAALYADPEQDYEVSIIKPDTVSFPGDRVNYLEAKILDHKKVELNALIKSFNDKYDRFVESNYPLFLQKAARTAVDSFKVKMEKEYGKNDIPYFQTYMKYSFASLDMIATENRHKVYGLYLDSMPVEYSNDSYMTFFNEFYNKQFESFTDATLKERLLQAINGQKSYDAALAMLSKEKLLGNERIRDLVLIKGLYENFNNKEFDKKSIRLVLKEIVRKSKFAEHAGIAMNILEETGRLSAGNVAPAFSLYDKNGKLVSLAQFQGKYVYLDFWATWCTPCLKEMPRMEALKKKYEKDIEFISISIDNDAETMNKYLSKKNNYDWIFLHYGNKPEIKELYNVLAIPAYFLINPDGLIEQSPAQRPGPEMEEIFHFISTGKKLKRKTNEWDW